PLQACRGADGRTIQRRLYRRMHRAYLAGGTGWGADWASPGWGPHRDRGRPQESSWIGEPGGSGRGTVLCGGGYRDSLEQVAAGGSCAAPRVAGGYAAVGGAGGRT